VLRLERLDMDEVERQLKPKVEQAPGFFLHTPVVVDLRALPESDADVGFPQLVGLLRGLGMIPVGVRGGTEHQQEAAAAMELAIFRDSIKAKRPTDPVSEHSPASEPSIEMGGASAPSHPGSTDLPTMGGETRAYLVERPVRSGQRIYAPGGDLTVTAPVNAGAELMADGNIHVYAPLRGRAIAGLRGDRNARIFCSNLQAELLSVAGNYRVSDSIPAELKGRAVQVFLQLDRLRIEPM
jgi:septum site-determining protein MinC